MSNKPLPRSPNSKTHAAVSTPSPIPGVDKAQFDSAMGFVKSPTFFMLLGVAIVWWFFLRDNDPKHKLAKGKWGGVSERQAAKKTGMAQVDSPRKNACTLYINKPEYIYKLEKGDGKKQPSKFLVPARYSLPEPDKAQRKKFKQVPTIWIPDAQTSTIIMGRAGSGKTFSAADPMLRSAIDQGFSTILYDFKYPGQALLALYAKRRGYKVHILAPGYAESSSLNLLDFIKNSTDAVNAEQIAKVIVKNCQGAKDKGDPFFTEAGESLVQGLFLLTKWVDEHLRSEGETERWDDLMTTACLLNMPNLAARLQYAMQNPNYKLSRWVMQPLVQLMSTHGSGVDAEANKTETSIVATAQGIFGKFIKKDFISAFCQKSSLPVDIDGKTLIIFGLDQESKYSVSPLLATIAHMIISRNVNPARSRISPLVCGFDELPSIYLPALADWLAQARSAGFTAILGIQTFTQLVYMYGEELAKIILTNCGNKIFMHPGDIDSAEMVSKFIGEEEIVITSTSKSSGKNGSTTTSKNAQAVSMIAPNELLGFKAGQGIAVLSGSEDKKRGSIPLRMQFQISQRDLYEVKYMEDKWPQYAGKVAAKMPQLSDEQLERLFADRSSVIEKMFPEPPPPPE
jgi:type IV secretory pathway TraG/TraD family ATPase VirD4